MDVGSNILQVAIALLATLGILILCAYFAKKLLAGSHGTNSLIKVLATRTLGSRERLMLVELQGETVLIGVTQHNISKLHTIEGGLVTETEQSNDFDSSLRNWMQKK